MYPWMCGAFHTSSPCSHIHVQNPSPYQNEGIRLEKTLNIIESNHLTHNLLVQTFVLVMMLRSQGHHHKHNPEERSVLVLDQFP